MWAAEHGWSVAVVGWLLAGLPLTEHGGCLAADLIAPARVSSNVSRLVRCNWLSHARGAFSRSAGCWFHSQCQPCWLHKRDSVIQAACVLRQYKREQHPPATRAWEVRVCIGCCCWLVARERQAPITVSGRDGAGVSLVSLTAGNAQQPQQCALCSLPVCVATAAVGQDAKGAFAPAACAGDTARNTRPHLSACCRGSRWLCLDKHHADHHPVVVCSHLLGSYAWATEAGAPAGKDGAGDQHQPTAAAAAASNSRSLP
jgi:hypothetical protein